MSVTGGCGKSDSAGTSVRIFSHAGTSEAAVQQLCSGVDGNDFFERDSATFGEALHLCQGLRSTASYSFSDTACDGTCQFPVDAALEKPPAVDFDRAQDLLAGRAADLQTDIFRRPLGVYQWCDDRIA